MILVNRRKDIEIGKTRKERINVSPYVESYLSLAIFCQNYALRTFILKEKSKSSQSHLLFFPFIRIHNVKCLHRHLSQAGLLFETNPISFLNSAAQTSMHIHNITGKSHYITKSLIKRSKQYIVESRFKKR